MNPLDLITDVELVKELQNRVAAKDSTGIFIIEDKQTGGQLNAGCGTVKDIVFHLAVFFNELTIDKPGAKNLLKGLFFDYLSRLESLGNSDEVTREDIE